MEEQFPSRVLALAEQVKGIAIAFKEYDDRIVIVFEDGRKLDFMKDDAGPVAPSTAQSHNPPHGGKSKKEK